MSSTSGKYTDEHFVAGPEQMPTDHDWHQNSYVRTEKWCGSDCDLFKNVSPMSMKQGLVEDCWILSAITGLAEFPDRIKKIFNEKTISKNGAYSVTLHYLGIPKTIVVDDIIPTDISGKVNVASSKEKEIWISILEKAAAKLHGSYTAIEKGNPAYGFEFLGGAPSLDLRHETVKVDELKEKMKEADANKWIMAAGTRTGTGHTLVEGHAYSAVGVVEVMSEGNALTLI
jgi:hypothetical protein